MFPMNKNGSRTRFLGPMMREVPTRQRNRAGLQKTAKEGRLTPTRVRLAPTQARSSCDLLITPTISCGLLIRHQCALRSTASGAFSQQFRRAIIPLRQDEIQQSDVLRRLAAYRLS